MNDRSGLIKAHWDTQAETQTSAESVTLRDLNQRRMEIDTICKHLDPRDALLEVGCGNGYSTQFFAQKVTKVTAVDYSEPMIARAKQEIGESSKIEFQVRDVLDLQFPPTTFDSAVVQRCLINLPTWEKQRQAIKNIASVLQPGGRFIIMEGTQDGLDNLNMLRARFGLETIIPVSNNLNFREAQLLQAVKEDFEIVNIHKFGVYDFVSRVVHPLLVKPNSPTYDAHINNIARELTEQMSAFDEMSRLIGLVLKKR